MTGRMHPYALRAQNTEAPCRDGPLRSNRRQVM